MSNSAKMRAFVKYDMERSAKLHDLQSLKMRGVSDLRNSRHIRLTVNEDENAEKARLAYEAHMGREINFTEYARVALERMNAWVNSQWGNGNG